MQLKIMWLSVLLSSGERELFYEILNDFQQIMQNITNGSKQTGE